MDRQLLKRLKPIVSDIANNLIHAHDQTLAACLKISGVAQKPHIYYPFCESDAEFNKWVATVESRIGSAFSNVVANARTKHKMCLSHILFVKQLSNRAKHWNLSPTTSSACGIAYFTADKSQKPIDIPGNHFEQNDEFMFRAEDADPQQPMLTLIQFRIEGIPTKANCDPTTIFSSTLAHLRDVIANAEKVLSAP